MHGDDRISELSESLLTQILSYLPTKDSVKTSVLSSRWKSLWRNVPVLDLDCHSFPYKEDQVFFSFIDRFLEFKPELSLQKFKVKCKDEVTDGLHDQISVAINRGVQHLDVKSSYFYLDGDGRFTSFMDYMPLNLYTSKTLVSLKLEHSGLDDPGFVYMPCLRFMHLLRLEPNMNMEKLFLGCPVLEELILLMEMYDEFPVTFVRSLSLKRFCVPFRNGLCCNSRFESTLEIDAPGLEYLSLKHDHYDRYVVKNLTSLFMADLNIKFLVKSGMFCDPEDVSKRNEIREFLTGISSVRHMIISQKTVKALDLYSKGGVIPEFNNLSCLQAVFPRVLLQFLPYLLETCPNLKHLILKVVHSKEVKVFHLIDVPRCLLSTLECIEIKGNYECEEAKMQIASYFLENSAILKKVVVSLGDYPQRVDDSDIYEELNKLTKRSPSCQIIIECSRDCEFFDGHEISS